MYLHTKIIKNYIIYAFTYKKNYLLTLYAIGYSCGIKLQGFNE